MQLQIFKSEKVKNAFNLLQLGFLRAILTGGGGGGG